MKHRVAVVVLIEAESSDLADAQFTATLAVRQALAYADGKTGLASMPYALNWEMRSQRGTAHAHKVIEAGAAFGNRYLWVSPTPLGFSEWSDEA